MRCGWWVRFGKIDLADSFCWLWYEGDVLGQWRLGSSWELLLFMANSMAQHLYGVWIVQVTIGCVGW